MTKILTELCCRVRRSYWRSQRPIIVERSRLNTLEAIALDFWTCDRTNK
ncbi:MAG: hypothetical protein M1G31_12835 [Pseudanabaena sp. Salubria-1]|nr:hypothetical protein [Pseudanabaena sp. Salubria-1]